MKSVYLAFWSILFLVACSHRQEDTDAQAGMRMLDEARQCLATGNATAARDTILSMRKRFPRAIEARRQAVLTLDSAELMDARQCGDSLRIEFYLRKIKFDQENHAHD